MLNKISKDTPCPFGPGRHELSKVRFTFSEKYWLGRRIVFKGADVFSLPDRTSRKFAKAFRDGTILNPKGHRPPTFDDISCKSMRDWSMKELKLYTPDILKLMNKEAELTAPRRGKSIYQFSAPRRQTLFCKKKRFEYWIWHRRRDH